jgi:acid phosphatase family membrane protein YuiD
MNRGIGVSMLSMAAAQLLKVPIKYVQTGKWDRSMMIETGGMPSAHSAGVSSLAAYTALKKGLCSVDFAISAIFGGIVMYDAMGVRRHAGEIAVEVNQLDQQVEELANEHPGMYHRKRDKELKESLGHMPNEVIGGALLGVMVGIVSYLLESGRRRAKY